jgi:4-amino-4-deoxy-L-arabinose transferase-like glycosyltransferase
MENKKEVNGLLDKFFNWKYFLIFLLVLSFLLIIITNQVTLRNFPNCADEYNYYTQAKLFSQGKLSTSSPIDKEFFNFFWMVNNGKYYSGFPFGWPIFLSIGLLIKLDFLPNIIFALLTLFFIFKISSKVSDIKTGKIAILLLATSPFFIFYSASYFSHSSMLFFASLAFYLYLLNIEDNKKNLWFFIGLILGITFLIRQFEGVIFCLFFFAAGIFEKKFKFKEKIKIPLITLAGLLIPLAIFFLYNHFQTGNFLLTPLMQSSPYVKPFSFNNGFTYSFVWAVNNNIFNRILLLNIWVPFSFLFMFLGVFNSAFKKKWRILLISFFLLLFIFYFFYVADEFPIYGPRYMYSSIISIFILVAMGLRIFDKRIGNKITVALVILNIAFLLLSSGLYYQEINSNMQLYDYTKTSNIQNSIIFVSTSNNEFASGSKAAS